MGVSDVGAIRHVLGTYPPSGGLFREILQNSEDARASKQIFVLDNRSHGAVGGSSLLAYNDSVFTEQDFDSLSKLWDSSKKRDASKIGKFGMGFRSTFHMTDTPQVLSESTLSVLDPLKLIYKGDVKLDVKQEANRPELLKPFALNIFQVDILPDGKNVENFNGTIVRLPLRTTPSEISNKVFTPKEIKQILMDFIDQDLRIVMLFLKRVRTIEIHEIDADGSMVCLATTVMKQSPEILLETVHDAPDVRNISFMDLQETSTGRNGQTSTEQWRIIHASFRPERATASLARRLGYDAAGVLDRHRVQPDLAIAVKTSVLQTEQKGFGRLFTYLPLPLHTNFPVHIHGLFALESSRARLLNREEKPAQRTDQCELIEWNSLLFEEYLPQTWMYMLHMLKDAGINDIFMAWPPAQGVNQSGDSGYWEHLPKNLLERIVESKSSLWPAFGGEKEYFGLESVLIGTGGEFESILRTLAAFGMKVTRPPREVVNLLKKSGLHFRPLLPETAYAYFMAHSGILLTNALQNMVPTVLRYLLSTGELKYIIDLPLIPVVKGPCVALERDHWFITNHTMLEAADVNVFGARDATAIPLGNLDSVIADLLRERGSATLNVRPLTPEIALQYLKQYPVISGLSGPESSHISWLSTFWLWMQSWIHRHTLYQMIQEFPLLPVQDGLKPVMSPIFDQNGLHPTTLLLFKKLGIPFFDQNFAARSALQYFKRFSDVNNLCNLLDALTIDTIEAFKADEAAADGLLNHIAKYAQCQLTDTQRHKLRRFPIFPLAIYPRPHVASRTRIQAGSRVIGVNSVELQGIPQVPNYIILDGSRISSSVVRLVDQLSQNHIGDVELLRLGLGHLTAQTPETQKLLVRYMAQYKHKVPGELVETLGKISFVSTALASKSCPRDLIDPASPLAILFARHSPRFPSMTGTEKDLVDNLRVLNIMHISLSSDLIKERIHFIVQNGDRECARNLLAVIYNTRFALTSMPEIRYKWLPTPEGLRCPEDCRDDILRRRLFDLVLSPLEKGVTTDHSIRKLFKWDQPVAVSVIVKQLSAVLNRRHESTIYDSVYDIVHELINRVLSKDDMAILRESVSGQNWIPVTSTESRLQPTECAVFSGSYTSAGFYPIAFSGQKAEDFFVRAGCSKIPSSKAILKQLHSLQNMTPTESVAEAAVCLLRLLPKSISDEERSQVLVPDFKYRLSPIQTILYNDIAERSFLVELEDGVHLAYHGVDEGLADDFAIERLGLKYPGSVPSSIAMGETFRTTIRNTLAKYTYTQILTEFLANASDAGATHFGILVDEHLSLGERLLKREMAQFQNCPSVIFYNNSLFTDADFRGLCNTGVGGKVDQSNTIGQFGYGALTMFHITDLPMILSGDQVLFIDPSKDALPGRGEAIQLKLKHLKEMYPDHLACLSGVFGFDISLERYDGTIFRLPLRQMATSKSAWPEVWTVRRVMEELISPFENVAEEFLLFTPLCQITIHRRSTSSRSSPWKAISNNVAKYDTSTCKSKDIDIHCGTRQTSWRVVSMSLPLPSHFSLSARHRLRSPIVIALAVRISENPESTTTKPTHRLFSTMPLSTITSLPVHLSAPFILSDDRRQIRMDRLDSAESTYHDWLLEQAVPLVYISLLANLLASHGVNRQWWPGNTEKEDHISGIVTTSFYKNHLKTTKERILLHAYNPSSHLLPSEAVLLSHGQHSLQKVFQLLKPPIPLLPHRVIQRAIKETKIDQVTPSYMRDLISHSAHGPVQQLSFEDIHGLIQFLCLEDAPAPSHLLGLCLLPLSDQSFTTFEGAEPQSKKYFTALPIVHTLFPNNGLLVHQDFTKLIQKDPQTLTGVGINVEQLSIPATKLLLHDHIKGTGEAATDEEKHAWFVKFWKYFPQFWDHREPDLSVTISELGSLPIVATTVSGCYTSINSCKDPSTVLLSHSEKETKLCKVLSDLSLTVVAYHSLPQFLRLIFSRKEFPAAVTLDHVLSAMAAIQNTVLDRFSGRLDNPSRDFISQWFREQFAIHEVPPVLQSIAQSLPIWPIVTRPGTLSPANKVKMLRRDISADIARRFVTVPAVSAFSYGLAHLKIEPLSWATFLSLLDLPRVLPERDVASYKELIMLICGSAGTLSSSNIRLPDCNRVLRQPSDFYARDALFLAAFDGLSCFLHREFQDRESHFVEYGLKATNSLDFQTFRQCARAIHDAVPLQSPELQGRATTVFECYRDILPRLSRTATHPWHIVDDLRFIPRHQSRRRTASTPSGMDPSAYVAIDLPPIVSPGELLLSKFEAVAWTQRAFFLNEPNEDDLLLRVHSELGKPTFADVVKHLETLALRIFPDYPTSMIILRDLEETYTWLNNNCDESNPSDLLLQLHDKPLFLNVSDPFNTNTERVWHCGSQLLLNDKKAEDPFYPVGDFLAPFEKLLCASGVEKVEQVRLEPTAADDTPDSNQSLRTAFMKMREDEVLIDVVFISDDEEGGVQRPPLLGHRAFLATYSSFLYDAFTNGMDSDNVSISFSNPKTINVGDYSSRCVQLTLDFAYKGVICENDMDDVDLLLEALKLSDYWMMKPLFDKLQRLIIERGLITLATWLKVKTSAELCNADLLEQKCEEYRGKNQRLFNRLVAE